MLFVLGGNKSFFVYKKRDYISIACPTNNIHPFSVRCHIKQVTIPGPVHLHQNLDRPEKVSPFETYCSNSNTQSVVRKEICTLGFLLSLTNWPTCAQQVGTNANASSCRQAVSAVAVLPPGTSGKTCIDWRRVVNNI